MRLMDQDVLKQWIQYSTSALFIFVVLFLTVDLFGLVEDFVSTTPKLIILIQYLFHRVIYAGYFLLPISVILGSFLTVHNLRTTNEWISYLNAGLSPERIVRYPFFMALATTILMIVTGIYLLPHTSRTIEIIQDNNFLSKSRSNNVIKNIHFKLLDGRSIRIKKFNTSKNLLQDITLSRRRHGQILSRLDASKGYFRRGKGWVLTNVQKRTFTDDGSITTNSISDVAIPLEPPKVLQSTFTADPRRTNRHPSEYGLKELITGISIKKKRDMNIQAERVYLHWKFSFPLSVLVLGTIGLILGASNQLNKITGICSSFIIGFGYWIGFNTMIQFGQFSVNSELFTYLLPILSCYGLPVILLGSIITWKFQKSGF